MPTNLLQFDRVSKGELLQQLKQYRCVQLTERRFVNSKCRQQCISGERIEEAVTASCG